MAQKDNYHLPPAQNTLPELKTEFADVNEKGAFVNSVMQISTKAMTDADNNFNQFLYPQAHSEYLVSLDGFMHLMKLTKDDANFQNYCKTKLNYLFDRAEKCKTYIKGQMTDKKVAGFYNQNDNPDTMTQLQRMMQQPNNAQAQQNQEIANMIRGIELHDAEQQARDEAALKAAQERGAAAGQNDAANMPQSSGARAPNTGAAAARPEGAAAAEESKTAYGNLDPAVVKSIEETILDDSPNVHWDDVKGLADVKQVLKETIIMPTMRPDIFRGLLAPSKGILLYGPPGNGKTMLAKAIATECQSTFFNCSASTLTSKWMGEGEKLMKALFAMANAKAPAVIFIDEIDSIMGARGGQEHEASRRLKTEFLVQFDGVNSAQEEKRILVLAATNRPQDLDEAALRRMTRRIYMPLPDGEARKAFIEYKMKDANVEMSEADYNTLLEITEGYSCADLNQVVKEAAMIPLREIPADQLMNMQGTDGLRPISLEDFRKSLQTNAPSVSNETIEEFAEWRRSKGQV